MGDCKGCKWNGGTVRIMNNFGIKESRRNCLFFGYIETWRRKKKCPARWHMAHNQEVPS